MNFFTCKVCNTYTARNVTSLIKHTKSKHSLDSQHYYDTYLKKQNEGSCVVCNNTTKFLNANIGYRETCCHTCGGILHRRKLKNNTEKYQTFIDKVKENLKQKHANRTPEEEKKYRQKIGNTMKRNNSLLSKEVRKEKFGWLNKLSPTDKKNFIDNVLTKTGAHNWWKTATTEEKENIYSKRAKTYRLKTTRDVRNSFKQYRAEVDYLTRLTYRKYKDSINPLKLKRGFSKGLYHIDHKYSVSEGFKNNIPCEVIACRYNLQMLEHNTNISKHSKCIISQQELLNLYEQCKT